MSIKSALQKTHDKIFLDYDIEKLEVTIEVYERQLANMYARLNFLKEKKNKNKMMKK